MIKMKRKLVVIKVSKVKAKIKAKYLNFFHLKFKIILMLLTN